MPVCERYGSCFGRETSRAIASSSQAVRPAHHRRQPADKGITDRSWCERIGQKFDGADEVGR
jgi:hypothetical protein